MTIEKCVLETKRNNNNLNEWLFNFFATWNMAPMPAKQQKSLVNHLKQFCLKKYG